MSAERRLARDDDERAPLLEHHVGGAREERVARSRARSAPPSPSSRGRRHRVPAGAAARERAPCSRALPQTGTPIASRRSPPHSSAHTSGAVCETQTPSSTSSCRARSSEHRDEAPRVRGAARAGDPDDDLLRFSSARHLARARSTRRRASGRRRARCAKPTSVEARARTRRARGSPPCCRARYAYAPRSPETRPPTRREDDRARRRGGRRASRARVGRKNSSVDEDPAGLRARAAPRARRAPGRRGCARRSRRRRPRTLRPRTGAPARRRRPISARGALCAPGFEHLRGEVGGDDALARARARRAAP